MGGGTRMGRKTGETLSRKKRAEKYEYICVKCRRVRGICESGKASRTSS
jgi:hypothetical protein